MTEIDQAPAPVLPRELAEISDAVRAVGAPPTPTLAEPYEIRLADPDADAEMVSEWMNRPHLVEAWEYDWPPSLWDRYLSAQLAGEYSRPLIGSFRGKPFVYVELYRAAKDSIAPRYDADPHDIGLHAAIADLKFVNRGIAPILFTMRRREHLRARTTLPPNHVRSGSPQQRCAPAMRIRWL